MKLVTPPIDWFCTGRFSVEVGLSEARSAAAAAKSMVSTTASSEAAWIRRNPVTPAVTGALKVIAR